MILNPSKKHKATKCFFLLKFCNCINQASLFRISLFENNFFSCSSFAFQILPLFSATGKVIKFRGLPDGVQTLTQIKLRKTSKSWVAQAENTCMFTTLEFPQFHLCQDWPLFLFPLFHSFQKHWKKSFLENHCWRPTVWRYTGLFFERHVLRSFQKKQLRRLQERIFSLDELVLKAYRTEVTFFWSVHGWRVDRAFLIWC